MMHLDFPYQFDGRGRTADTDYEDHIRDLIEQVLFTAPGERVNRPDFGSGLRQLLFEGNSDELAATTQYLVEGALQQWLSDLITVEDIRIESEDATLRITVAYTILKTQEPKLEKFEQ